MANKGRLSGVLVGAWVFASAVYIASAITVLFIVLYLHLDDRAHVGIASSPARAVWATWPLGWAVFAVECAAVALSICATLGALELYWLPDAGVYVFFWALAAVVNTGFAAIFLLWAGVLDLSAVVSQAAVVSLIPAVLAAFAEMVWAAEAARVKIVGWDRTVASRIAWGAVFAAWLFLGLGVWICIERAIAATLVRGDSGVVAWVPAWAVATTSMLPVAAATARRALDGYYTRAGNEFAGLVRTSLAAGGNCALACVFLVCFRADLRNFS